MTEQKKRDGTGGGIFVAIMLLIGTAIGIYVGQPSLGLLGGLVAGLLVALVYWLIKRSPNE